MRTDQLIRPRDEAGSLIIAMMIVMVIVLLSSLLLVRVVGNEGIVQARQSAASGISSANAGLSDALFRLDQGDADTGTSGVMCLNALNPSDTNCKVQSSASTPQLTGVSYVARTVPSGTSPDDASEWQVQALGNAQTGMRGAVQQTLTRSALYPFALFGKTSLTFTGNTQGNFGTFTPGPNNANNFTTCPSSATSTPCLLVGSDGTVSCSGPSPLSIQGVYYNTGSGGGSDSCGTAKSQNVTYNVPDPVAPSGALSCPNNGKLGSGASPAYATIAPGTYLCTSEVTVTGTLTVSPSSGPVQLYIMIPSAQNTSGSTFFYPAADSQINTSITYSDMTGGGPQMSDTLPTSEDFQVFSNSVGVLDVNGNHGFVFGGILYAPDASLTANGCKSYIFGSATINTYTCHGGPNLGIYYDSSLGQDFGPWQISGYQQINPGSVSIP
ncbi:MAG TPA: hypothetical protein VG435_00510 [Acidimicrobiales bacterium]|jgi:hypothetical protein|nr:hypothetical protein [Acidimicrobiales bacterium]